MAISRMQQQRQMYGLGSLVKKITKPIKKLAKSPVGKAALTAAALYGVNRFGIPGTSGFGKGSISDLLLGKMKSFGPAGKGFGTRSGGLLSKLFLKQGAGKFSLANLSPLKIGGIGALGGLTALGMGGDEEEETIDEAIARSYGKSDLDIPAIRKAALGYSKPDELYFTLPEAFRLGAAQGGIMTPGLTDETFAPGVTDLVDPVSPEELEKINDAILKRKEDAINQLVEEGFTIEEAIKMISPDTKSSVDFTREELGLDPLPEGKAEGGLMNLGGKEMDLRGGGFVPIGAKEKADDVPARLSKNEFVFTADAVRAAGGGSVDKGAQKMYNTMKQLENKI